MPRTRFLPSRAMRAVQRGASIIELMVGVLIGMIVVAVVYNVLVMAEGLQARHDRRGRRAGHRAAVAVRDRPRTRQRRRRDDDRRRGAARCADWRLKALPVAITAGADANTSDSLLVFYSTSPRIVHPVRFSNFSEQHAHAVHRRQPERLQARRLADRDQPRRPIARSPGSTAHRAARRQRVAARERRRPGQDRLCAGHHGRVGRSTPTGASSTWDRN